MKDISKKQLISLIDDVILSHQCKYLVDYMDTDYKKLKHDQLITKFAIMFFCDDLEKMHQNLILLLDFYKELEIPLLQIKYAVANFFREYKSWKDEHKVISDNYYNKVLDVYKNVFNDYYKSKDMEDNYDYADDMEDEFLFIEDEGVDSEIDHMHYNDEDKITAKEYFQKHPIDEDDIDDIIEKRDIFVDLVHHNLEYSDEFMMDFDLNLSQLNLDLELIFAEIEFKDVGYGLNLLSEKIENIGNSSDELQKMFFSILITFIEDLVVWLDSLFIEQTAIDLHYLDASLLANVSQLSMMLEQVNN